LAERITLALCALTLSVCFIGVFIIVASQGPPQGPMFPSHGGSDIWPVAFTNISATLIGNTCAPYTPSGIDYGPHHLWYRLSATATNPNQEPVTARIKSYIYGNQSHSWREFSLELDARESRRLTEDMFISCRQDMEKANFGFILRECHRTLPKQPI